MGGGQDNVAGATAPQSGGRAARSRRRARDRSPRPARRISQVKSSDVIAVSPETEGATSLRVFGHEVPVRAHVETLQGLSAHADADRLLRWLRTATHAPRCVFVVHGDPVPAQTLAMRIKGELGWTVAVPKHGESVSLD